MHDEEQTDASAKVTRLTVETCQDEDTSLAEGEDDCEELLRSLVEFTIGFQVKIYIDQVCSSKQLRCVSTFWTDACVNPTWKTMPDDMMGVVPSSINVPRLLASIIRSQYIGSEVSEETMP